MRRASNRVAYCRNYPPGALRAVGREPLFFDNQEEICVCLVQPEVPKTPHKQVAAVCSNAPSAPCSFLPCASGARSARRRGVAIVAWPSASNLPGRFQVDLLSLQGGIFLRPLLPTLASKSVFIFTDELTQLGA